MEYTTDLTVSTLSYSWKISNPTTTATTRCLIIHSGESTKNSFVIAPPHKEFRKETENKDNNAPKQSK